MGNINLVKFYIHKAIFMFGESRGGGGGWGFGGGGGGGGRLSLEGICSPLISFFLLRAYKPHFGRVTFSWTADWKLQ